MNMLMNENYFNLTAIPQSLSKHNKLLFNSGESYRAQRLYTGYPVLILYIHKTAVYYIVQG